MKYSYLVKENHKTQNMISENEKSLLSTNEDFKKFIGKKTLKNDILNKSDEKKIYKEVSEMSESSKNVKKNNKTNSVIFESEINTVEILVKYTSNIYNLLVKLILLISKLIVNTYDKIPSNYLSNEINYDEKKMIKKINKEINTKNNKTKIKKNSDNIKKINSYLIDLD